MAGEFSSPESTLCADSYSVSFPYPMLPQWHVKDPGHSAKSTGAPKHAYTIDQSKSEWTDYATIQAECGNLSGNELTRNSSGNTRSQSSQIAEPLWTDPGLKSGISLRGLISTFKKKKKKKKRRRGMNCQTFFQNPRARREKSHQTISPGQNS